MGVGRRPKRRNKALFSNSSCVEGQRVRISVSVDSFNVMLLVYNFSVSFHFSLEQIHGFTLRGAFCRF